MSVTPGSSSRLNTVRGVSAMLVTTAAEEISLATKVLPANILVKKSDDKIYITDGIKTLANIDPLIDQVLTAAEKTALSTALSTGTYVAAAGGVVVHDATGKIDDGSLNVVDNGKLVESYLSDYIDQTTHKVLLSALPDTVRAGVTYVADITARDALSAEQKKSLAFVIDATSDATVTQGAAMYGWDATANSGAGAWIKIAEVESLDLNVAEIECSYTNAQAAGAIMYDHPLLIDPLTATDFAALITADSTTPSTKLYFKVPNNWSKCYVYYFGNTTSNAWPGDEVFVGTSGYYEFDLSDILTTNPDLTNQHFQLAQSPNDYTQDLTFTPSDSGNIYEITGTTGNYSVNVIGREEAVNVEVVEIYVFASDNTTWILTSNGDLYGCGYNDAGQQGSGNRNNVLTFTKRASNVKEVSCSYYTTWYIDNNNDLYGCGSNGYGKQGSGDKIDVKTFTKRAENVKTVSCSEDTTWYIDNNNNLYGCGRGDAGQQGSGNTSDVLTFTKRAENVKEVICSYATTWYIDNNNDLYGCGNGGSGRQGSGDTTNVLTFTKRASNVKKVSCSFNTTWYIDNNNNLYGCGLGSTGQQGSGDDINILVFTKRAENVREVSCTNQTTWYIDNNNNLYGCGSNSGNQGSGNSTDVYTFTKRAENVKEVSCSKQTTWYIDASNNLYGCGLGSTGQQGSGDTTSVKTFTKRAENVKTVSCTNDTTWYIDTSNNLYGCGSNEYGKQGSGDTTNILVFTKRDYKTE